MSYYTIEPSQKYQGENYSSWQPQMTANNNIRAESDITSNWKYRQYMQKNAKEIMKYNSMQYINDSGNNPFSILNTQQVQVNPHLYNSIHDINDPLFGFRNSDLKHDYLKNHQIRSRMVAPSIPTNFF